MGAATNLPSWPKEFVRPHERRRDLTRDDGINLGFDYDLTRSLDLSAGYSRSVYSALNTFSFGIEVNVASLLKSHPTRCIWSSVRQVFL